MTGTEVLLGFGLPGLTDADADVPVLAGFDAVAVGVSPLVTELTGLDCAAVAVLCPELQAPSSISKPSDATAVPDLVLIPICPPICKNTHH